MPILYIVPLFLNIKQVWYTLWLDKLTKPIALLCDLVKGKSAPSYELLKRSGMDHTAVVIHCKVHHTCFYRVVRQRAPRLNEQFSTS